MAGTETLLCAFVLLSFVSQRKLPDEFNFGVSHFSKLLIPLLPLKQIGQGKKVSKSDIPFLSKFIKVSKSPFFLNILFTLFLSCYDNFCILEHLAEVEVKTKLETKDVCTIHLTALISHKTHISTGDNRKRLLSKHSLISSVLSLKENLVSNLGQ